MVATRRVAKALLLDKNDNFLLLTRGDNHPRLAGFPDLPGGTLEAKEEPGHAVLREIKEETGLSLTLNEIDTIYTTTQLINGKSYPTILYAARINEETPEVLLSWEHKAFEWAHLDRLAEVEPQLVSTYAAALRYIRENDILAGLRE